MELHERALQAYVAEPKEKMKEFIKERLGHTDFGKIPDEKVPAVNVTELSDSELGDFAAKIVRWSNFLEEALAIERSKVRGAKEALDYVKSQLLKDGTKKDHVYAHESYITVNLELQTYLSKVEALEALSKRYNSLWKLVSREISRRSLVFDKEKYGVIE